ncbi:MAG: LolA family protein [Chitinophagaceae bacterium]
MKKILIALLCLMLLNTNLIAQNADELVKKVRAKLEQVNDYVAEAKLRTDVAFIKAPVGRVKVYFQKPNKLKIIKEKGISILPKGGVSINSSSVLGMTNYTAIDAGEAVVNGIKTKMIKLLPLDENSDVVITTLYIDEASLLIRKSATTTKENGSFEMEMFYTNYKNLGLPDKMVFSFNVKDYKIPKGVTLEFDDEIKPEDREKMKKKKGKVEFLYTNYIINKGIDAAVFKN